jgi:hypothetical protein
MNEKKGLLDRLVAELNRDVPNLGATAKLVGVESIEIAGAVQSSFAEFNSLVSSSPELFLRHSALLIYHIDATFFSLRALREALCSYYGAAGSLLRNACEAILRGSFWECLAHRRYRDRADVLAEPKRKRRIDGSRRNVLDWMNDVLQNAPHLEAPLENQSGEIFDRISPLFGDKVLSPAVPSLRTMVEQLSAWRMFEPMSDPVSEIYDDLYWLLCKDTHVIPDMTMMGRLMAVGKDPSPIFEPTQEEFDRFRVHLCRVAEVGALAVLNVLEDDARTDHTLRAKIASKQSIAEGISLPRVVSRIQTLAM